jgi:bacterioferritin
MSGTPPRPGKRGITMKGDPKVIEYLQKGLRSELTAINQYMLHSRMLEDWGIDKLASFEGDEAMDEMRHADRFIKRILFLEALPNLQDLDPLRIGENVREILENDRVADEEGHFDFLDTQLGLIESMGYQNYLQSQAGDAGAGGGE